MRILIVCDITSFMRGGVSAETAQLMRGLVARGHQVAFLGDVLCKDVGPVEHFKLSLPLDSSLPEALRKAIEAFEPDIVHVIDMGGRGLVKIAEQLKAKSWVFTCHSVPPYESNLRFLHWNETAYYTARSLLFAPNIAAWKWFFRRGGISHAIVHSQLVEKIVVDYGQPAERISLITLGCEIAADPNIFGQARFSPDHLKILTVGGIVHTKGYHDALFALADLHREFRKLEYEVIGEVRDRSYLSYLKNLIVNLKLTDVVRFSLNAADSEKERALRQADLYLQPSHEEGFCLSYIEAASIVPRLVGTDTGAIGMISADDRGARVVPVRRPVQIANAVRELCAAPLPKDHLLQRRNRLAREFSWSTYFDSHEELYKRLMT